MSNFDPEKYLRSHIKELIPYSSARDEYSGAGKVFLDANENPFEDSFNRYPDPYQHRLKKKISGIKDIPVENIFLGNGSDEAIDLILRAFGEPKKDSVVITPPTYGMYEVSARLNDLKIISIPLKGNFQLDTNKIREINGVFKIIFLCSPNNPTGTLLNREDIEKIIKMQNSIVVIDEAYIDFTKNESWSSSITNSSNLIVLQTLSKAWGMAGLRIGMAFANKRIIEVLNKIKPPYNISSTTQSTAYRQLEDQKSFNKKRDLIIGERERVYKILNEMDCVENIVNSEANFLLIRVTNAEKIYNLLLNKGIVVRNRSGLPLCDNSLRITIGTPEENDKLVSTLENLNSVR